MEIFDDKNHKKIVHKFSKQSYLYDKKREYTLKFRKNKIKLILEEINSVCFEIELLSLTTKSILFDFSSDSTLFYMQSSLLPHINKTNEKTVFFWGHTINSLI